MDEAATDTQCREQRSVAVWENLGLGSEMTRVWTRTHAAFWVRNGYILLLWRINLQERVVTAMTVKDSWSSSVTPRFLAVGHQA